MKLTSILQRAQRIAFGVSSPKARYIGPWQTDTAAKPPYAGLDANYVEYRRDTLIRRCVNVLAAFATNRGFKTVLEAVDEGVGGMQTAEYEAVKRRVDAVNAAVNLDHALFVAVVKAKIYGVAGFEIVANVRGEPERLLPLRSEDLEPELDAHWNLLGFNYEARKLQYKPHEILYFANNQLEGDYRGLSEVEPVRDTLQTRRSILQEAFKEAAKVLWAGMGIHRVNTKGLSDAEANAALTAIRDAIKPGKHIVVNQDVESRIVDIKPNLAQLAEVVEYLDADIIGNFGVPRFLIGREKQFNRATAFAEAQLFIRGPIADIQRWLRRELEAQWYRRLVRLLLNLSADDEPPIRVKHQWNPITISDFAELAQVVSQLYMQGNGVLPRDKAIELLDMDPEEVLANKQQTASQSGDAGA